jgi:hypothetical protein
LNNKWLNTKEEANYNELVRYTKITESTDLGKELYKVKLRRVRITIVAMKK